MARSQGQSLEEQLLKAIAQHCARLGMDPPSGYLEAMAAATAHLSGQTGHAYDRLFEGYAWSVDEADARTHVTPHVVETLYAASLASEERRTGGIVYTPPEVAQSVVEAGLAWVCDGDSPLTVVDPAAGSGAFLVAVARMRSDAQMIGIDPSREALAVASQRLAFAGAGERAELVGSTAQEALLELAKVDLVVGNPPYVRHEARPLPTPEEMERLADALALSGTDRRLRMVLSGRADLYAAFFLYALAAVRPGGVVAFVTGDSWLDTEVGTALQGLLLDLCSDISVTSQRQRSFRTAGINTVITVLRRKFGTETATLRFDGAAAGAPAPGKWAARYLRVAGAGRALQEHPAMRPLGTLASLSYGNKPGIKSFFVLDRLEAERRLESDYVRPCLTTTRDLVRVDVSDDTPGQALFVCPHSLAELRARGDSLAADYVERGSRMESSARARHTVAGVPFPQVRSVSANRPEWHCLKVRPPGAFVIPCLFGNRLFVAHNRARVLDSNAFFHGDFEPEIDERVGLALLNSSVTCLMMEVFGRPKGLGGLNLYGPELRVLPVPDPAAFTPGDCLELTEAFDALARRPILSLREELAEGIIGRMSPDRLAIDRCVFRLLGWSNRMQQDFYDELLQATTARLEKGR